MCAPFRSSYIFGIPLSTRKYVPPYVFRDMSSVKSASVRTKHDSLLHQHERGVLRVMDEALPRRIAEAATDQAPLDRYNEELIRFRTSAGRSAQWYCCPGTGRAF